VVWQKAVGHGFSGPVVADRKLILFHRLADNETVECLDARTGSPFWSFAYPTSYQDEFGFDHGPRATPAIAGERVADFASGKVKGLTEKEWKEETRRRLAESESVTAKVLAAKQVAATSKRTSKSPLRRLWR